MRIPGIYVGFVAYNVGTVHIIPNIRGTSITDGDVILVLERLSISKNGLFDVQKLGVPQHNPCREILLAAKLDCLKR